MFYFSDNICLLLLFIFFFFVSFICGLVLYFVSNCIRIKAVSRRLSSIILHTSPLVVDLILHRSVYPLCVCTYILVSFFFLLMHTINCTHLTFFYRHADSRLQRINLCHFSMPPRFTMIYFIRHIYTWLSLYTKLYQNIFFFFQFDVDDNALTDCWHIFTLITNLNCNDDEFLFFRVPKTSVGNCQFVQSRIQITFFFFVQMTICEDQFRVKKLALFEL